MRRYTWPWGKAARGHAWSLQTRTAALGDAATWAFSSRDLTTVRRPSRRSIIAESPCRLEVFPGIRHQYQCSYRAKMRAFCLRLMFLETLYFLALWVLTDFGRPFK